ncbi:MAG TPA: Rne/Rng family ribonuclease [Thermoanaerobaculia bacterium]|nr:Rne/Rng family ribonuclease [Thermoanaerobaculia bacterium]
MRKDLLINATPPETRVALLEDGRTVEVLHERKQRQGLVGNVYLGRVHRVLPGMQAAFVSIGLERDAFLYVEDVLPRAADFDPEDTGPDAESELRADRPRIDDLLKEGQEIVVQVTKDPLAGKGPRVAANLSLPGRTLVYLPGVREVGISRRITDESERERLRQILEAFPGDGGFIARTAAHGSSPAEFATEHRYLLDLAARIERKAENSSAPALLHRELDLAQRAVRDLVTTDFEAIRVDDEATHARLAEFLAAVAPPLAYRLELHRSPEPLFEAFGVEAQIENALKSRVVLPSGSSIVIHQTEALVAIDINTGKYVGKEDLEETVYATNLEAIPEVARQIRLRDLGGLLVVDFIDMLDAGHRQEVFERFEAELAKDRARFRMLPVSEFGLIEITRQRSRGNLEKLLTRSCPDCGGSGRVKTDLSVALELRRALFSPTLVFVSGETVRVRVRPALARFLAEEEPDLFADFEREHSVEVELVPDETLPPARFEIVR